MVPVAGNSLFLTFLVLCQLIARAMPVPRFPPPKEPAESSLDPRINCSDCKQHISNRIRQMQHLERMKHRIMTAIKSKGSNVPQPNPSPGGPSPSLGVEHGRNASRGRGTARTSLTSTNGPKIVSFSRVVSSGKRRHVLQFTLNPAAQGKDLEVVKAHLWLLLTLRRSHGNNPEVKGSGKVKVARKTNSSSEVKVRGRKDRNEAGGRKRRHLAKEESNNTLHGSGRKPQRSGSYDKNADEGQDDEDDERFKAVLRVILVSENGTKQLMTYLRTKVKVTHWLKVRLPVSVIQQQLRASQSTLTLMIRCGRCGRDVRMVLPKAARSSDRRAKRKGRKRRKKGGGDEKRGRKKGRRSHSRHGAKAARAGLSRKSMLRKFRKNFRPSPFLVINTRVRRKGPH